MTLTEKAPFFFTCNEENREMKSLSQLDYKQAARKSLHRRVTVYLDMFVWWWLSVSFT